MRASDPGRVRRARGDAARGRPSSTDGAVWVGGSAALPTVATRDSRGSKRAQPLWRACSASRGAGAGRCAGTVPPYHPRTSPRSTCTAAWSLAEPPSVGRTSVDRPVYLAVRAANAAVASRRASGCGTARGRRRAGGAGGAGLGGLEHGHARHLHLVLLRRLALGAIANVRTRFRHTSGAGGSLEGRRGRGRGAPHARRPIPRHQDRRRPN